MSVSAVPAPGQRGGGRDHCRARPPAASRRRLVRGDLASRPPTASGRPAARSTSWSPQESRVTGIGWTRPKSGTTTPAQPSSCGSRRQPGPARLSITASASTSRPASGRRSSSLPGHGRRPVDGSVDARRVHGRAGLHVRGVRTCAAGLGAGRARVGRDPRRAEGSDGVPIRSRVQRPTRTSRAACPCSSGRGRGTGRRSGPTAAGHVRTAIDDLGRDRLAVGRVPERHLGAARKRLVGHANERLRSSRDRRRFACRRSRGRATTRSRPDATAG